MIRKVAFTSAIALAFFALTAHAHASSLKIEGIKEGKPIPEHNAYCAMNQKDGGNVNPKISWTLAPKGTQSYALIMVDKDVPAVFDDANKEGKILPVGMKRQDFYHWVLIDIPANMREIAEGADSKGITKGGKAPGKTAYGINGLNDYSGYMKSPHGGYDGPCPPWNDERIHHYHFQIYALDVPTLGISDANKLTGNTAIKAMEGHILGKDEMIGTYSLKVPETSVNP